MSLRGYIINNFWWKFLSLLLALVMWLTIKTSFDKDQILMDSPVETTSTRTLPPIPVAVLTASGNTNRYVANPTTVEVTFTGSSDELHKLVERDVNVYVDLAGARDEKQLSRPVQCHCPAGIGVASINPAKVIVERLSTPK